MLDGVADGPLACPLLTRFVENQVDQRLAGLLILLGEDLLGDIDEVAVEFPLVPFGKDLMELLGGRVDRLLQDCIGLADELHIAVLDAVVDHLDVVTGTIGAHVAGAGLSLHNRGDLAEDRADRLP